MGIFDFLKKKGSPVKEQKNQILLAMPMFDNGDCYNIDAIVKDLKSFWGLSVTEVEGDSESTAFKINGEMVVMTFLPVQIPRVI